MTSEERKHRITTLKHEQKHRLMLNSIAPVTDECNRLGISYSLVFPHESSFPEPLTWIGDRFPTSSVRILWELVEDAECVRWKNAVELEQGLMRLCGQYRIEEAQEILLVFGGNVPHIGIKASAVQAIIGGASEIEAEWWMIPREQSSRAWILECSWSGELWCAKI